MDAVAWLARDEEASAWREDRMCGAGVGCAALEPNPRAGAEPMRWSRTHAQELNSCAGVEPPRWSRTPARELNPRAGAEPLHTARGAAVLVRGAVSTWRHAHMMWDDAGAVQ
jgi:hypothetical protein